MAAERGGSAAPRLQIRVTGRKLIKASDHNLAPYVLSVSNLDLLPNTFQIALVSIYPKPQTGDFASVLATIKTSLPAFLNHYFPFAGRIVSSPKTGLPVVHCNNLGAELVVGHAAIPLARVDFHHMDASVNKLQLPFADEIPLSVQVVSFACGGFSIAWATNHLLVDGHGHTMLASQWCEFARTGKLSTLPNHDRSIFPPRSPPSYSPAVDHALGSCSSDGLINVLSSDIFVRRLYHVDVRNIKRLKGLANQEGRRATRMEAVSAYLWKALAGLVADADETCRMAWWVNGRKRLNRWDTEAMQSYLGNVITCASAEAGVEDLRHWSLSRVAAVASDAMQEVAKETYFQELIDWVEEHKMRGRSVYRVEVGLGSPAVIVTSFLNFRLDGDFGCGMPVLMTPTLLSGGRLGTAFLQVLDRTNADGSWIISAVLWRQLAEALESDANGVFEPVTADYLGLWHARPSRL